MGLEAEREILADEESIEVAESGIEKRAAMDSGDDGGHVHVGGVHDERVVKKTEAPSPLVSDACCEVDEKSGEEKEEGVEEREWVGEAGGAEKTEPSDEEEELEDEFVREEVASGPPAPGLRRASE